MVARRGMHGLVKPTIAHLAEQLRAGWSARTASSWTADNPAQGQCSVTALVVQDMLGGSILKTRVGSHWHFYNFVDGNRIDLTRSQFAGPIDYDDLASSREDALTDTSEEQYRALRQKVTGS